MKKKRTDYLSWDDYFMAVAQLSAQRSKDPSTQVGAMASRQAVPMMNCPGTGRVTFSKRNTLMCVTPK
jgi:hypothetical protein